MKLHLLRSFPQETETLGDLFVEGNWFCHTLEDRIRPINEPKVPGETAIPYGTYGVIINWSPRFNRPLPLLLEVPDFSGIRIHPGNTAKDTEGCILVGDGFSADHKAVLNSRVTFNKLFPLLQEALAEGISIEILKCSP